MDIQVWILLTHLSQLSYLFFLSEVSYLVNSHIGRRPLKSLVDDRRSKLVYIDGRDSKRGCNYKGWYPNGSGIPKAVMIELELSESVVWMIMSRGSRVLWWEIMVDTQVVTTKLWYL